VWDKAGIKPGVLRDAYFFRRVEAGISVSCDDNASSAPALTSHSDLNTATHTLSLYEVPPIANELYEEHNTQAMSTHSHVEIEWAGWTGSVIDVYSDLVTRVHCFSLRVINSDSVTFNNVKQGKPACNGDDNVLPKRVDSSKVIMVNGGTLPKEDGSRVEKDVKNTGIRDKAPAVGVVNDNVLPRSSTELSGRDATPRPRNVHDDGHEAKSNIDDVPPSQQGDTSRTPPVANGNFAKFEKEEGELSPNVYFDEADLAAYGDHNGSNAKAKHSMEIDADADDEDSKNVLEGGDDVSGSESTGRSESEREAEGIEDANFISADGTYSDHIFLNAKPLAKRVASPLHDGGKKDCNVFYGNESFYALFRLHQVRLQFA
ncbi:paired amphipathic helix protein Sin3-like protein 2 isoform X3, partial [Tanacetum coccineum]